MNDIVVIIAISLSIAAMSMYMFVRSLRLERQIHRLKMLERLADTRAAHYFRLYRIYHDAYWKSCGVQTNEETHSNVDEKVFG